MPKKTVMIDGNTAAAHVAHATNEVIAIYPITPSSVMGELADEYSAKGKANIWGTVPTVVEMQSEAGAAGAVHGALTTGALTTTFTASQGLLLMIPNMFKIAGELTPTVFHIAARAVACQALSIFGDHSDVMATRSTGFALLSSGSVQEVMDFALIAQAASLESKIPFLHFFDGFRTSSEVQKVEELTFEDMKATIDPAAVAEHRRRGLNPERPVIRGTSQNPDVYFIGRETVNKYYAAAPAIVEKVMAKFAKLTGRAYKLFDYFGAPDADRIVVIMGSGAETMEEVVACLTKKGEKVGVLKVRLYRPWSVEQFIDAIPASVRAIAVLDRTKEPGALGEPLYEDVRTAIGEAMSSGSPKFKAYPKVVGGRYGLGSAEFTGGMAKAVLDNLKSDKPKNHFTIGIIDDVTHSSLEWDEGFSSENEGVHRGLFYGLASDGTVSANKNSIKIIGESTDNYAQGYFVYDSKKSGTMTTSHLRFGSKPIKSAYLCRQANFIACHKFSFLEQFDMLADAEEGGVFLLNSPYKKDEVWRQIPLEVQKRIIEKKIKFYVIDAGEIAEKTGMGNRINTIMQTAFFVISGVLDVTAALSLIKQAVEKTYGAKGPDVVKKNMDAIDATRANLFKVDYPKTADSKLRMKPPVTPGAPKFIQEVIAEIIARRGDKLPVSKLPDDGTYPVGTTQYEKRNIAEQIPVWEPEVCIQCGECSFVCPHAVIRLKMYDSGLLAQKPKTFKSTAARGKEFEGKAFTIQVSPEDCTGCGVCVNTCPAFEKKNGEKTGRKAINMAPQIPLREQEVENFTFFLSLPDLDQAFVKRATIKGSQLLPPMFEFSGACAGCGETPYVKLLSQLFGDRAVIANATGCSSIYGGNLPTTPYAARRDGRGPAWSNSLFEDAAEFGFGMRLTSDKLGEYARELLDAMAKEDSTNAPLYEALKTNPQKEQAEIEKQRGLVADLRKALAANKSETAQALLASADHLIRRSVWIIGGDGWAYDIGYGGLDHVLASGKNVNLLVLDTEVYSNTGGQMSKSTPIGAVAKFAAGGKPIAKKDLGLMAMSYGYVYVARVAMGANKVQALRAFLEADAYDGPSLIIAYSTCINQGIDMTKGMDQMNLAVQSGMWPLFRYNPELAAQGQNPFKLESKEPSIDIADYMYNEIRFRSLRQMDPARAEQLLNKSRQVVKEKYAYYKYLAERKMS